MIVLFMISISPLISGAPSDELSPNIESDNKVSQAQLIEIIRTFMFQNLDSADIYLSQLKQQSDPSSSSRAEYLKLELIYHYYRGDIDSAIYYTELYYDYGVGNDDINIKAYGLTKKMLFYEFDGDIERGHKAYQDVLKIIPDISDRDQLAKLYSSLGARVMMDEQYELALSFYLKIDSLYAVEDISNRSRAMAMENIGGLYGNLKDPLALEYFLRSKEMYAQIDDVEGVNSISLSLSKHFIRLGDYPAALEQLKECKEFFESYGFEEYLSYVYSGFLLCHTTLGELNQAETYHNILREYLSDEAPSEALKMYKISSGELFYHKKDYTSSIQYYLDGMDIGFDNKSLDFQALGGLTDSYEAINDYRNAFKYSELKLALKDSINKLRNYQSFQTLETQYKTKQKEEEIELLNTRNELIAQRSKVASTVYLAIISIVALLAGFLYFLYHNRQKLARQLDQVDKLKNKFFTNISHEFRTPLTVIGGLASHMLRSSELDSTHVSSLQSIQGNVQRLSLLTNQLIDLNKLDADKVELRLVNGDIHAFVRKYVGLFMSYVTSQEKVLKLTVPEVPLIMDFDEEKMQSVLFNLLQNAIKYTGDDGVVEVKGSLQESNFILKIIDNGEGINPANLNHVFDRFYTTSEHGGIGAGVGLAYVKEIINLLQGDISVSSRLGEGSTFRISLPFASEATKKATFDIALPFAASNQTDRPYNSQSSYQGDLHMLIVEDNRDIQNYLKLLLQDDFLTTVVSNGQEAIDILNQDSVDFILSDVMMPVMDGFELCNYVKSNREHSHIPFILITAKTSPEDKRRGHQLGVDAYLTKPFDEGELLGLISNLLRKRKAKIDWFTEVLELKSSTVEEELLRQEDLEFIKTIQSRVLDNPITYGVEDLSRDVGMSARSLRNKVKTLTGVAINKYSNHIRIEKAKELLKNTDHSISQVGSLVGYEDVAYFSRVFKKYTDRSPKNFRNTF